MRLSLTVAIPSVAFVLTGAAAWAETQWLDDVRVSNRPGMDRVVLDVKEDNSVFYTHISGSQAGEHLEWLRSIDGGATWQSLFDATWVVSDRAIGAAYGFGTLVQVWEFNGSLFRRTLDATTGAAIFGSAAFANESPRVAKEIIVDSNAETIPAGNEIFIACAKLVDPGTEQVTLKVYRSTNHGNTWGDISTLDTGPVGDPNYIGDVHMVFSVAGFPYFHIIYARGGLIRHVRTSDAGVSWSAPATVPVAVDAGSEVSVAAFGIFVLAAGQQGNATDNQVVYCNSTDAGVTWSVAKILDGLEAGPRMPSVTCREAIYQAVYRKPDGHLATRRASNLNPAPSDWSAEEYATLGTTDLPSWICGFSGGDAGVVYIRREDNGYPYFATRNGAPITAIPGSPSNAASRLAVFPTPASGPVKIVFNTGSSDLRFSTNPTGSVVDVSGRVVARLTEWRPVGLANESIWNGRDVAGKLVPAGIYLVRVDTPRGAQSARVTIVR